MGGSDITVTGTNFVQSSNLQCKFGSTEVAATYVTGSLARCVTPAAATATSVTVEVSNNNQDYTASGIAYTYQRTYLFCPFPPCTNLQIRSDCNFDDFVRVWWSDHWQYRCDSEWQRVHYGSQMPLRCRCQHRFHDCVVDFPVVCDSGANCGYCGCCCHLEQPRLQQPLSTLCVLRYAAFCCAPQ